jgi:hypothetical protein
MQPATRIDDRITRVQVVGRIFVMNVKTIPAPAASKVYDFGIKEMKLQAFVNYVYILMYIANSFLKLCFHR